MKQIFLCAAIWLAACASTPRTVPVDYELVDHMDGRYVEIKFKNTHPFAVCLAPEMWPNEEGMIDAASDFVYLIINEERYSMKEFNTGYCPGCTTRVEEGEQAVARIPYEHFTLPEELFKADKDVQFAPRGVRCN